MIVLKNSHDLYKAGPLSFDRAKMSHLCDATVVSIEGDEIQAHRSLLAARLEYFHSMFAHGWAEVIKKYIIARLAF